MISTSLSPNTQKTDLFQSFKLLFHTPKNTLQNLETHLKNLLGLKYLFLTNSGRSAYLLLLQALGFPPNSQIATQAFTCNATINPLLWAGLKPLYIDIDQSLNLDPKDLEKKITKNTKAIVVQHTFGNPANLKKILYLAQKHKLPLIEDCAHAIAVYYQGHPLGTFGQAAYFSFGRDKAISSIYGGLLATNNQALAQKIQKIYEKLPFPSSLWTKKQLLHPLLFAAAKPFYHPLPLGKAFLWATRRLGLITPAVAQMENQAQKPKYFPARLPPALAALVLSQIKKLGSYQHQRDLLQNLYQSAFPTIKTPAVNEYAKPNWLRFPLLTPKATAIAQNLKKKGVFLENWYQRVIDPPKGNLKSFHYLPGSCPQAESLAGNILSLPTNIQTSPKKAKHLIKLLQKELGTNQ